MSLEKVGVITNGVASLLFLFNAINYLVRLDDTVTGLIWAALTVVFVALTYISYRQWMERTENDEEWS